MRKYIEKYSFECKKTACILALGWKVSESMNYDLPLHFTEFGVNFVKPKVAWGGVWFGFFIKFYIDYSGLIIFIYSFLLLNDETMI